MNTELDLDLHDDELSTHQAPQHLLKQCKNFSKDATTRINGRQGRPGQPAEKEFRPVATPFCLNKMQDDSTNSPIPTPTASKQTNIKQKHTTTNTEKSSHPL